MFLREVIRHVEFESSLCVSRDVSLSGRRVRLRLQFALREQGCFSERRARAMRA